MVPRALAVPLDDSPAGITCELPREAQPPAARLPAKYGLSSRQHVARHDDPLPAQGQRGRGCRRRSGDDGPDRRQVEREEAAPARRRLGDRRVRRRDRRRDRAVRAAGSNDGGGRQERVADPQRHRRCAGARGWHHRHRLGRRLRARRSAGADRDRRARRRDRGAPRDGDRRRHLHLHQRQRHSRKAGALTRMTSFSPREIVSELDRFIVGQNDAKRAVAIALRNRWRRQQLAPELREEVLPKNILMIGPTGCGKTEIARRLARLAQAPFIKVEATKFTEVGYVGRDVEQIARDLVEIAISMTRERLRKEVAPKAEMAAEERVLDALVGNNASAETRQKFRKMLREGSLDDREIEITVQESAAPQLPTFDIPGMPGAQMGMLNLGDIFGKAFGQRAAPRKTSVAESHRMLLAEESDKLLDQDSVVREAIAAVEENGIVFLDEIDKICGRSERGGGIGGADVSREGVQRDLLPLIEGTTVATKHGPVKTDHILFIASGAFHLAKPSDLLPELQGRLPIRVELKGLDRDDLCRILTEPQASLITQYKALMATEGIELDFLPEAIEEIALLAEQINSTVENIGARRLHTILERLLEEVSFTASDQPSGTAIAIDADYVRERVGSLAKDHDLSRFIL